jgi:hypothetical protein
MHWAWLLIFCDTDQKVGFCTRTKLQMAVQRYTRISCNRAATELQQVCVVLQLQSYTRISCYCIAVEFGPIRVFANSKRRCYIYVYMHAYIHTYIQYIDTYMVCMCVCVCVCVCTYISFSSIAVGICNSSVMQLQ